MQVLGTRPAGRTTFSAWHRLGIGTGLALAIAFGTAGCGDSDAATGGVTDSVTVTAAWARPTPGGATTGAVYLTVESSVDDSITAARVSADIAGDAQLHGAAAAPEASSGQTDDDAEMMMTMRETDGIDLVAGEPLEFAPGGTHIMILDLLSPLTLGQEFAVELKLASGVSAPATVVVADTAPSE